MNPATLHAVETEALSPEIIEAPAIDLERDTVESRGIELERAADAARELLLALGEDPRRDGLRDTPRRVAKAYAELLTPQPFSPTTFPNDEGYDELVVARDIPFNSLCEHHMLPFQGVAHVGYLPGERIVGLSKLGRVVELFARRLQVQERLTVQIADFINAALEPAGVAVVAEGVHMCSVMRGVKKANAEMVTSAMRGVFRDDPKTRAEFMSLVSHAR
jgi:GTP cyclohydrolase I